MGCCCLGDSSKDSASVHLISTESSQSEVTNNGSWQPELSNNKPRESEVSNNKPRQPEVSNNNPRQPEVLNNESRQPEVSNNASWESKVPHIEEEEKDIFISNQLFVCLDIGTYGSGYAFNLKLKNDIHAKDKDRTCILILNIDQARHYLRYPDQFIKEQDEVIEKSLVFKNAKNIYDKLIFESNCEGGNEPTNLYYFEYFKMNLYEKEGKEKVMIKTLNKAKELPAEDVFGFVMLCLKRAAIKKLKFHGCKDDECNQIHWIVTVPAIWTDKSKQIMRKAAEKAHLYPKNGNKNQLRLALEPEAAALSCLLNPEDANDTLNRDNIEYLIIDGGGGTIDITAHKVINNKTKEVKEILKPCGLDKGSYYINKQFEKFLHTVFGDELCEEIKNNSKKRAGWNSLMETFEICKLVYSGAGTFTLDPIPISVIDSFGSQKDFFDPLLQIGIKCSAGMLLFPESIAMSIFEVVISPIVNEVENLFKKVELKNISCILLVGGFSNCLLLRNRLEKLLKENNYNIILVTPTHAEKTIAQGGCLFAKFHKLIVSRKSRYTYGIGVGSTDTYKYRDNKHPVEKDDFGNDIISKVFHIVVRCEEDVDEKKEYIIDLARGNNDTSASFPILASSKKDVKYSDDDSVRILGTLKLSGIPLNTNKQDTSGSCFRVQFLFQSSEICVTAKYIQGKSSYATTATLEFDTF